MPVSGLMKPPDEISEFIYEFSFVLDVLGWTAVIKEVRQLFFEGLALRDFLCDYKTSFLKNAAPFFCCCWTYSVYFFEKVKSLCLFC